jgi:hypothetical protein
LKSVSSRVLLALGLGLLAAEAFAVPAFARRYEVNCSFCHQVFPKLNRMGERFKERGFRLENEEPFVRSNWIRSGPVSGRIYGTRYIPQGRDASNAGYLKVLSAGNLGPRFSYWIDDAWLRAGGQTSHLEPDNAWIRFDLKPSGKLYAKAGRFELDLPASQSRTPHLLPYTIYSVNTGLEPDTIGAYQQGLEVGAEFGTTRLSFAVVQGRNFEGTVDLAESSGVGNPGRFDGNVFARVSRRRATSRFGAFAYVGRNDIVARLNATRVGVASDRLLRLGVDGSARIRRLNVYGVAMYGSNSNSVLSLAKPSGTGQSLGFAGGFLAVDYHPWERLALTSRLETRGVDLPGTLPRDTLTSFLSGAQLVVWKIKVSTQVRASRNDAARFAAIQVETAF